jgi:hypothetical protein
MRDFHTWGKIFFIFSHSLGEYHNLFAYLSPTTCKVYYSTKLSVQHEWKTFLQINLLPLYINSYFPIIEFYVGHVRVLGLIQRVHYYQFPLYYWHCCTRLSISDSWACCATRTHGLAIGFCCTYKVMNSSDFS